MIDAIRTAGDGTRVVPLGARAPAAGRHGERIAVLLAAAAVALLPLAIPTGPGNVAPIDMLLVLGIGACLVWAGAVGHRWRFPYAIPVGLLVVGGVLGALHGPAPSTGAVALAQDALLVVWCSIVVNLCRSAANLRILLSAWVYGSIAWVAVLFVGLATGSTELTGQTARQGSRVAIALADPNYAANYFFVSIMLIWATGLPRRRPLRIGAYLALLVGIALTGSNSGLVTLAVGTTVAGLLGAYRRWGIAPVVALFSALVLGTGALVAVVSPAAIQEAGQRSGFAFLRDGIGRSAQTGEDHALILREGLRLYRAGGVLGEGPVSTKIRLRAENAPRVKEAHSDYVAALVERGVIGFVGLLLLVVGLLYRAVAVSRSGLTDAYQAVVRRPNALVGALAGTLTFGIVYEALHVRHVWTVFGLVAALYIWGRR